MYVGGIVRLVRPAVSEDTVLAVAYLKQEIDAGRIVGLAWVAIHPGQYYSVDFAGEARKLPTFTRGMVEALSDQLAKLDLPK